MYIYKCFDKFLFLEVNIKKCELQLVGVTCLFISSKLRECIPMSTSICIMYTDDSINRDQLLEMELIILNYFKWDIQSTLAVDLLMPILATLQYTDKVKEVMKKKVRSLLDLCLIGNC